MREEDQSPDNGDIYWEGFLSISIAAILSAAIFSLYVLIEDFETVSSGGFLGLVFIVFLFAGVFWLYSILYFSLIAFPLFKLLQTKHWLNFITVLLAATGGALPIVYWLGFMGKVVLFGSILATIIFWYRYIYRFCYPHKVKPNS